MELTLNDYRTMLDAARAQHRALTRMREDLRRNDLSDIDVNDGLYAKQAELYDVIEKLQVLTGEIVKA